MQAMPICLRLLRHFVWRAFPLARARAGRSSEARMAIMAMTTNSSISVKARRSAYGRALSCIAARSPPKPLYFVKYNEPASSGLEQRSKLGPRAFQAFWVVPDDSTLSPPNLSVRDGFYQLILTEARKLTCLLQSHIGPMAGDPG